MEDIMHDIRWSTPGQLHGADLAVVPGTSYRLELLISANHNEHRQWDITLDDGLQAVDGLKSLGIEGTAEGNSYDQGRSVNYRYDFVADDPKFEVRLGQFFGGGSGGDQNPIWQALTLHQTNEDPSIAELDGDLIQGYVPGSPNVAIDVAPAATVTDPDGSFGGGSLTVTRTSGGEPVDLLTVRAQQGGTGLDGGTNEVRVGGTTIGVMASGGIPGQDLVINFNANATAARVTTLMPLLEFGMIGNGGASHSKALEVQIDDGSGGVATANTAITLTLPGGVTTTWTGAVSDDWFNAGNWTGNVPGAADKARFSNSDLAGAKEKSPDLGAKTANVSTVAFASTADGFDITAKTSNSVTGPAVMNVEVINTGDFPELGGVTDGLEMWFDAADIDAGNNGSVGDPGNGQVVQTWRDRSGNNHHATLARDNPVVLGNSLNGLPAVEAVGEEYWNVPGSTFIKTTFSVFRAGNNRTTWDNHGATLNRRSGRGSNWLFENNNTTLHGNQYPAGAWKNGQQLSSPFNMGSINEFMIFTVEVNGNDTGGREHYLGRSDHSQTDIELAEVIAYNRTLSAGERQAVESYLGAKWGIGGGGGNPATDTASWLKVWDAIDAGEETTGPIGGANVVNYASDQEVSFDYAGGGGDFAANHSVGSINDPANGPGGFVFTAGQILAEVYDGTNHTIASINSASGRNTTGAPVNAPDASTFVSLANMGTNGGTQFPGTRHNGVPAPGGGDSYGVVMSGVLLVDNTNNPGNQWTFGIYADDNAQIRVDLDGDGVLEGNLTGLGGETVANEGGCCGVRIGTTVTLADGYYKFETVFTEGGGGDYGEFFYAPGRPGFNNTNYALIGDDRHGIEAGQLESGPVTGGDNYSVRGQAFLQFT
ncbi:MAG: hypothetical protein VB875_15760, partial [Pirellulales bacterium]